MSLGTPVFGYRDSKSGKFFPQANFSFTVMSYCDGDRFSFPSWQMEVHDRKNISFVLVPDYMDKGKEITNHISSVIKRSLFSTIPDKKFKEYFRTQLMNHIKTKDVKRLIVSYTGNHHLDKLWQFFGNFFNLVLSCFVIFKKFLKLYRLSRG